MISQIIATQASAQIASIQRTDGSQAVLQNQNAFNNVREEERQVREVVTDTEEAVFYEPKFDAKEEGKNKYESIYKKNKKKKQEPDYEKKDTGRVNFDIKI